MKGLSFHDAWPRVTWTRPWNRMKCASRSTDFSEMFFRPAGNRASHHSLAARFFCLRPRNPFSRYICTTCGCLRAEKKRLDRSTVLPAIRGRRGENGAGFSDGSIKKSTDCKDFLAAPIRWRERCFQGILMGDVNCLSLISGIGERWSGVFDTGNAQMWPRYLLQVDILFR